MADDGGKNKKAASYSEEEVTAFLPKSGHPSRSGGVEGGAGTGGSGQTKAIAIGEMMGKYRIEGVLGRGGGGDVYAAEDTVIKRKVAIKMLPPELANDAALLARFHAEAQAAGRLNHPNVVTIYEVMEVKGTLAIVMELVPGGSMQEYLKRKGSPGWRVATRLAAEACKALMRAHEAGLIHRDIKPANLLLTNDKHVKVADFGLAKFEAGDSTMRTQAGTILGTPAFMSPEQCRGDKIDHRTDIYSLGCTYFAMLTGKPPFEAASSMQVMFSHCSAPIPNPCELDADTPGVCAEILTKALAKDPKDRYATARDMFNDLRNVSGGNTITSTNPLMGIEPIAIAEPQLVMPARRKGAGMPKWMAGAGAGLLVVLVGVIVVMGLSRGNGTGGQERESVRVAEVKPVEKPQVATPTAVVPVAQAVVVNTSGPAKVAPVVKAEPVIVPATRAAVAPATVPAVAVNLPVAQTKPAKVALAPISMERLRLLPGRVTNSIRLEMVLIRPGKFMMGDNTLADAPKHEVTISRPFYMGVNEVTGEELVKALGDDNNEPALRKGLPAAFVTWEEAVRFCDKLSALPEEKAAGHVYRLATEAEWEYACRAATTTRFAFGNVLDRQHANFGKNVALMERGPAGENEPGNGNGDGPGGDVPKPPPPPVGPRGGRPPGPGGGPPGQQPQRPQGQQAKNDPRESHPLEPVGMYPANEWGLHDMHGSVWEWCSDFYSATYYKEGPAEDPAGPETGTNHVVRGGCWSSTVEQCGSAYRNGKAEVGREPSYGFRVVMEVPPEKK